VLRRSLYLQLQLQKELQKKQLLRRGEQLLRVLPLQNLLQNLEVVAVSAVLRAVALRVAISRLTLSVAPVAKEQQA
jgi:hypothetical protein